MTAEVFSMPAAILMPGHHRAQQLARYGRHHEPEDLADLHPDAFQRMLNAARDDWHARETKRIAGMLSGEGRFEEVEAVAAANKWGSRL